MGTALVKACNDLPINSEIGSLTVLNLLDISAGNGKLKTERK